MLSNILPSFLRRFFICSSAKWGLYFLCNLIWGAARRCCGYRCRPTANSIPSWRLSVCTWHVLPVFVRLPSDDFSFLVYSKGSHVCWFFFSTGIATQRRDRPILWKAETGLYPRRSCKIRLFQNGEGWASSDQGGGGGNPEGAVLLLLLLLLSLVCGALIEFGWIRDRWRGGASTALR